MTKSNQTEKQQSGATVVQLATQQRQEKKEQDNSTSSTTYEAIKGTPFHLLTKEEGAYITMGNYRLNEEPIQDDPKEWLSQNQWDITLTMMMAIEDFKTKQTNKN